MRFGYRIAQRENWSTCLVCDSPLVSPGEARPLYQRSADICFGHLDKYFRSHFQTTFDTIEAFHSLCDEYQQQLVLDRRTQVSEWLHLTPHQSDDFLKSQEPFVFLRTTASSAAKKYAATLGQMQGLGNEIGGTPCVQRVVQNVARILPTSLRVLGLRFLVHWQVRFSRSLQFG